MVLGSGGAVEYIWVTFVRSRRVKIDGEFFGRTDELLELEPGRHKVTLGYPPNFKPKLVVIENLRDTNEFEPLEIDFEES